MKITGQTAEELVLEESTFWIAWLLAILTLPLIYAGIFGSDKRVFTPAAVLLLFAVAIARKSRVVFDARTRQVQWRKVAWLRARTGSLAFDEITEIGIQGSVGGSRGEPTFRLTIVSRSGTMPLAAGYCAGSEAYSGMRDAILAFMGTGGRENAPSGDDLPHESAGGSDPIDPMVLELVQNRQFIAAIALLRKSNPRLSLTEAKRRVDEMRSGLDRKA
jgi:hypothetical protein